MLTTFGKYYTSCLLHISLHTRKDEDGIMGSDIR